MDLFWHSANRNAHLCLHNCTADQPADCISNVKRCWLIQMSPHDGELGLHSRHKLDTFDCNMHLTQKSAELGGKLLNIPNGKSTQKSPQLRTFSPFGRARARSECLSSKQQNADVPGEELMQNKVHYCALFRRLEAFGLVSECLSGKWQNGDVLGEESMLKKCTTVDFFDVNRTRVRSPLYSG